MSDATSMTVALSWHWIWQIAYKKTPQFRNTRLQNTQAHHNFLYIILKTRFTQKNIKYISWYVQRLWLTVSQ